MTLVCAPSPVVAALDTWHESIARENKNDCGLQCIVDGLEIDATVRGAERAFESVRMSNARV